MIGSVLAISNIDSAVLENLLQYSVLGIIAFFFIRHSNQQQKESMKNFQTMLNEVLKANSSVQYMETILQTVQSHNSNTIKTFAEISNKIKNEQEVQSLLLEIIFEYNNLIKELKIALIKIKNNNSEDARIDALCDELIKRGFVSKEDIKSIRRKYSDKDLDILDDVTNSIESIMKKGRDE